ncbi:MAG: immunoglobulin domain-containing protein [Ferruginibacter sp.]
MNISTINRPANQNRRYCNSFAAKGCLFLLLFINLTSSLSAQQVTEIITDFKVLWKSTTAAPNATYPNTSHNLLSFKYNNVVYSTGANDAKLNDSSIIYTAANFQAFPVVSVGGVVGSGVFIALAGNYDGVPNGYSNPLPSLKIKDVLIDGLHGLDLGTGVTNVPASALISFPVNSITTSAISDAEPDILVSQIASPSSNGDTLFFVDGTGSLVGNKIPINWLLYTSLGIYTLDLYSLPVGSLCDTAKINGTSSSNTTRDIRLIALKLSEFGITTGNVGNISQFILKASGTSDPAFIAYNANSFNIPAPVITVQPVSQIICPNVSNSVTLSVTATGPGLTYQWRKNGADISGATSLTYIIANVISSSAGTYTVIVSNTAGSVSSNPAYLNISVAVQPSPAAQTIATGASDTLTISANNAGSYQWRKNGADIAGATSAACIISPVNTTDAGSYSVMIINSANGGCANVLSSTVTLVAATTLYSKPGVLLNLPGSWGVATNGTGSSPVNFTRAEHTFIVKNNASTGGDLAIAGVLDLANAVTTVTAGSTLDAGRIIRSGTGTIAGSATSNLAVRGNSDLSFNTGNQVLKNFTVTGGTVTLNSTLNITPGNFAGTVTLSGGSLITGDNLILKSDIAGTARLAAVATGVNISGKITMEKYISSGRGWRFLSVPVNTAGAPTINEAWQEGLTTASANPNLYPGYGIKISGGTTINGYDASNTNSSFIKTYNNSTNSFVVLPPNPGTTIPLSSYPAYCVYIRGDRSIDLMQGLNAAVTSTTLRIKGSVKTGDQLININNYTLVGNPFASAIDFGNITRTNVNNTMYVWDPKMAGNYGLGGYVTISWNNVTGSYDKTSSVSNITQSIQAGDAFFVRTTDSLNPGMLTVKESDKVANDFVARSAGIDQKLRVELFLENAGSSSLLDGVLTTFDDSNLNNVDADDAQKIGNSGENIGLNRNGTILSIERRKTISMADSVFLNITRMKAVSYRLVISAENFDNRLAGFIKDKYSNTINNNTLDLDGTTDIFFTVNSDPASYAPDRFSIVFEKIRILPVTFTSVKAVQQKKDIAVKWTVENELNIKEYHVETSLNGVDFRSAATLNATTNNNGSAIYSWIDSDAVKGSHYYKIRSKDLDGGNAYSNIIKVNMAENKENAKIAVSPNPVKTDIVSVRLNNMEEGLYNVQVFDVHGQSVKSFSLQHSGGNGVYNFSLDHNLPKGNYYIKITGLTKSFSTPMIKE